jgi:hypothetical protein
MSLRRIPLVIALFGVAVTIAGGSSNNLPLNERFAKENPQTRVWVVENHIEKIYYSAFSWGDSPEDSATRFVNSYAGLWGLEAGDLAPGNWFNDRTTQPVRFDAATNLHRFTLVYFQQSRDGVPVFRADLRLLARNESGYPLVLATSSLKNIGEFRVTPEDLAGANISGAYAAAADHASGLVNFTPAEFVIFAGDPDTYENPRLAIQFVADNGQVATTNYEKWLFVADANTGGVLYQESQIVHTDVSGTVSGNATVGIAADLCDEEVSTPLPYLQVKIGNTTAYSDANGAFTIANDGDSSVKVVSAMVGQWFKISDSTGKDDTLTVTITPPGPADFLHNEANDDEDIRAQTNCYLHSNVVRDHALAQNAEFPTIYNQEQFTVNVNLASTCNAYYDGSSINFFHSGGGCSNTGNSTIVHHEYGHHMVQTGGSGQGEYGEGMADCQGVLIGDDPRLALGFYNDCDSPLRNADNTKTYPCSGEIHDCGQLLSGCVWDTRNALKNVDPDGYRALISSLTVNSILLHKGSGITPQITIDFLTLDDDDDNLSNGSPHYYEIADGFGKHKMDAPKLDPIVFAFPNGFPAVIDPNGGTTFRVEVSGLGRTPAAGTGQLHYSIDGVNYAAVAMNQLEDNVYDAVFPAIECGSLVRYFVSAKADNGEEMKSPRKGGESPLRAFAVAGTETILTDSFESDLGWTVQNASNLTTGKWERGVPVGGDDRGQPFADYDGSGSCYLTDNRDGNYDVDGDYTRLISPRLDLSGLDTIVTYARWQYDSDSAGSADKFVVAVSNDDGTTWVPVETVLPSSDESKGGWYSRGFPVKQYVQPNDKIRVRFEVSDRGLASRVEGGLDAFSVLSYECGAPKTPGDMNCSGEVDFDDIDPFVVALISQSDYESQYPGCNFLNADVNGDDSVDFSDIDPFVELLTK